MADGLVFFLVRNDHLLLFRADVVKTVECKTPLSGGNSTFAAVLHNSDIENLLRSRQKR